MMKKILGVMGSFAGVLVVLCFVIGVAFNSSKTSVESTSKLINTSHLKKESAPAPNTKTDQNHLKEGQTVKIGDFEITLNSVRTWAGDDIDHSQDGKYVIANLTVKNVSNTVQTFSGMEMLSLDDQSGNSKEQAIIPSLKGSLENDIQPNGILSGEIAFEVEKNLTTFNLVVQGTDGKSQATFKLTNVK